MPAMSMVRNVALLGRPSAGPVIASISSIVYWPDSSARRTCTTPYNPRWLAMKFGVSFATTTPLPRRWSANASDALDDRRVGVSRRNELEQVEIPRRVEEMRAEPVPLEFRAAALGKRGDRNARRVRADDGTWTPDLFHRFEQRALDVDLLHHRFDDPVGVGQTGQLRVEGAGRDQRGGVGCEEGVGLQRARPLQSVARSVGGHVEQERRHAGVGQVRGNLRTHGAGAEDGDRPECGAHAHRARAPFTNSSTTVSASASRA